MDMRRVVPRMRAEDGNTLLLFPFAVLVLLALGGLALDAAVAFQADRRAVDEAAALANDIAGVLDPAAFLTAGGYVRVDAAFAEVATRAANDRLAPDLVCVHVIDGAQVEVTCSGSVRPIILPALGGLTGIDVGGTVRTSAVQR